MKVANASTGSICSCKHVAEIITTKMETSSRGPCPTTRPPIPIGETRGFLQVQLSGQIRTSPLLQHLLGCHGSKTELHRTTLMGDRFRGCGKSDVMATANPAQSSQYICSP